MPDGHLPMTPLGRFTLIHNSMSISQSSTMLSGFENRIMFGPDEMVWTDAVSAAIETIQSDPALTADQKRDILYNNAARFLRMKK